MNESDEMQPKKQIILFKRLGRKKPNLTNQIFVCKIKNAVYFVYLSRFTQQLRLVQIIAFNQFKISVLRNEKKKQFCCVATRNSFLSSFFVWSRQLSLLAFKCRAFGIIYSIISNGSRCKRHISLVCHMMHSVR